MGEVFKKFDQLNEVVSVAIVGKYTNLSESYKSLNEALFIVEYLIIRP